MSAIPNIIRKLSGSERGATAIEYGLIVALIGIAIVGALERLGGGANGMWTVLAANISAAS